MSQILSFLKSFGQSPDKVGRSILLVIVEGQHDIAFLTRISRLLHASDTAIPDLSAFEQQARLVFVPAGGGDFRPWLSRLDPLGCSQFHLYDREASPVTEQRRLLAARINALPRCHAVVTGKRSPENYLHPAAIQEASGLLLQFTDLDDVAELAARTAFSHRQPDVDWDTLTARARRRLRNQVKGWLNTVAVDQMTAQRLAERDTGGEVREWLRIIAGLIGQA
jgi:hypothetical protein